MYQSASQFIINSLGWCQHSFCNLMLSYVKLCIHFFNRCHTGAAEEYSVMWLTVSKAIEFIFVKDANEETNCSYSPPSTFHSLNYSNPHTQFCSPSRSNNLTNSCLKGLYIKTFSSYLGIQFVQSVASLNTLLDWYCIMMVDFYVLMHCFV